MRNKFGTILISILLFSSVAAGQQQDGSVLERRVSLNEQDQSLGYILDQVSWQTRVFFSYDAGVIDSEKRYSIDALDKSLFSVLNEIFNARKYKFTELENQVIITKREDIRERADTATLDTIPVKYYFLTSKLVDDSRGRPISYATISLLNKPIGTISNRDGEFLLKVHPDRILDTLVISCMGYRQLIMPAFHLLDEDLIVMNAMSIRIREVKVTSTTPDKLLVNIRENIRKNYSGQTKLMTGFYRETVKQDKGYISVSEAIVEILKAPYYSTYKDDVTRLVKGRQNRNVQPLNWLNFKVQGGPFSITKLDIVKTAETFVDEQYQELYKYNISKVISYMDQPAYVLQFQPVSDRIFPVYKGEMYVHRETFAVLHCNFGYTKPGLRDATNVLIKKKPRGVKVRTTYVNYAINYQQYQGRLQIASAQTAIKFRIRSKHDKLNSEFISVSDLLITDIQPTDLKKIARGEAFSQNDIFVDMIGNYDPQFWENYNIIQPDEDLRNAIKDLP